MTDRAALCLCLAEETIEEDLRISAEARGRAGMLELRVDRLRPDELSRAARFPGLVPVPVILAVRRSREGGGFSGEERERVGLLGRLAKGGFRFIELEEDVDAPGLSARIMESGARVLRSLHDPAGVPHDLARRLRSLGRGPSEVPKAVVAVKGAADLSRLIEACRGLRDHEKILSPIGEAGFPASVLATRLGSLLCYCHDLGDLETLEDVYGFHRIGPSTAVYGVIGNPVMHSRSPLIHNRGLRHLGMDAVYLPFQVPDLDRFWDAADALGVSGLSVTAPHKQAVLGRLSERDGVVDAVGACNTMVRVPGTEKWRGINTDVEGFLTPLRKRLGGTLPPGLGATVIGAGGAARAVVHALKTSGARVLVLNRSEERGRDLGAAFGVPHAGLDAEGFRRAGEYRDIIVQTTNVGMAPAAQADPAPGLAFTGKEIVYDLIYHPDMTTFLQRATEAGCRIVKGEEMLVAQAMEQFRLFTGSLYPRIDSRYPP